VEVLYTSRPMLHPRAVAPGAVWRALWASASRASGVTAPARCLAGVRPFGMHAQPSTMTAAARMPACSAASTRSLSSSASELVLAPKVTPPGIVRNLKEELWRRQKVATTYFTHPVAALEDIQLEAGSIELAASVFQQAERLDILNRVVLWQRAKKRAIARPAKTRAMVQGGGKKPWKQKGSGRARVGSIRSPIWKGGGKAHGPVPRSFAFDMPKKVRRLALRCALSSRMREGTCVIIQSEALKEGKTKHLNTILNKWGWDNVLFIGGCEIEANFKLAASNIHNCDVLPAMGANVYRSVCIGL